MLVITASVATQVSERQPRIPLPTDMFFDALIYWYIDSIVYSTGSCKVGCNDLSDKFYVRAHKTSFQYIFFLINWSISKMS